MIAANQLMTILQSWSQGVQVWGRDGMRKLWSASNVAIYGGGVKEPEFLNELSQMIGDYDRWRFLASRAAVSLASRGWARDRDS